VTKAKIKVKPIKSWAVCDGVDFWVAWKYFPYTVAFKGNAPIPNVGEHIHSLMFSKSVAVFEITKVIKGLDGAVCVAEVKPIGYTKDLEP